MELQKACLHKHPLLAAKRNSLGHPKQKIQRQEKARQLRLVSKQIIAITTLAKKIWRSLECCDDVTNKVRMCFFGSEVLCTIDNLSCIEK